MNQYKLVTFKIDNESYFQLRIPYARFSYCGYAEMIKVFFHHNNHAPMIVLRNDTLFSVLVYFKEMSRRLLSKELTVDQHNIQKGMAYNQSLAYHQAQGYSQKAEQERYKWGIFSLFANPENNSVWLYEHDNQFYIEIAPLYCALPTNTPKKFAHFMKNYRPKVVKKISRAMVEKWYKKVLLMSEQLKKNHERIINERSL